MVLRFGNVPCEGSQSLLDEQTGFNVGPFDGLMDIVVFIIHEDRTILGKPNKKWKHNTNNSI